MNIPGALLYTKTHEWVLQKADIVTVGITDFAQEQLSELTYVELPDLDLECEAGVDIAVLESVKAAADVNAPVSGKIIEVNATLEDSPDLVNNDPYGDGWIFKIKLADESETSGLLTAEQYAEIAPDA